ncbi:efflux RND transporter permease subunit [Escherichia coli]|nr:efflux RND transporter permease subunit [Escherichia coli]ELR8065546.1 efflux RND transporter permease subunit [Escherichia coli]EMA2702666.1 efflux RND transporter permease subunit [Escherichia coli]
MIEWIIRRSVANRFLVLMGALFLSIWGTWTIINTPVDALPDLSDVQVIIKTSYPGQAPQIVENQVTYPLTTTMLSVPGAKTVRGFSQFGDSYVYVIFEDGTDPYWARSRVLEYLNQVQGKLPAGVSAELGPDATGVGWIYEYALVDRSGKHDLADLRSLQDWFLKYELKTIPDVAEVASVGGVVKEYQVVIDPQRLAQYGISLGEVKNALDASNQEAGGSSIELAEAEYMVRASGYLQTLDDFNHIVLKASENGVPVYLRDVAKVQVGPEMRRGIAELNGEGEVAGGVVILRSGKNAREVIAAEFGVVMLMYLRHAIEAEPSLNNPQTFSEQKLDEALYHGAVLRVRPKAMTVAVIIAGLLPILWGTGAGSEVMSRIAAPMIGGMITAPLLSLFIIPAAYKLMWLHRHRVRK